MKQILAIILPIIILLAGFTCMIYFMYQSAINPANISVIEYEYDNHTYLMFNYNRCISVVHSPKCKCDSIQ